MHIDDLAIGVASGLAASGPMTLMMEAAHSALPRSESHPLPPRHISEKLTRSVGLQLSERQSFALAILSHFAYGGAAGAVYAPLARRTRVQPIIGGVTFGLCLWGASYLGGLPAVGLYPSPAKDSAKRTALMVGAHIIWGAALGLLVDSLQKSSEESASLAGASRSLAGSK